MAVPTLCWDWENVGLPETGLHSPQSHCSWELQGQVEIGRSECCLQDQHLLWTSAVLRHPLYFGSVCVCSLRVLLCSPPSSALSAQEAPGLTYTYRKIKCSTQNYACLHCRAKNVATHCSPGGLFCAFVLHGLPRLG